MCVTRGVEIMSVCMCASVCFICSASQIHLTFEKQKQLTVQV